MVHNSINRQLRTNDKSFLFTLNYEQMKTVHMLSYLHRPSQVLCYLHEQLQLSIRQFMKQIFFNCVCFCVHE